MTLGIALTFSLLGGSIAASLFLCATRLLRIAVALEAQAKSDGREPEEQQP